MKKKKWIGIGIVLVLVFAEGVLLVAVTSLLYFWQVKKDEALS